MVTQPLVFLEFFKPLSREQHPGYTRSFSSPPHLTQLLQGAASVQPQPMTAGCFAAPAKQLGVKGISTVAVERQIGI